MLVNLLAAGSTQECDSRLMEIRLVHCDYWFLHLVLYKEERNEKFGILHGWQCLYWM